MRILGRVLNHATDQRDLEGKQVEVVSADIESPAGRLRLSFTNAVPGLGLLRVELGKVTVLEALEWGVDEVPDEAPAEPAAPQPPPPADEAARGAPGPAPAAETTDGPPNPLYDAKVGEWVRMRNVVQGEETTATLRVVGVDEEKVRIQSRVEYGGSEIRGAEIERMRRPHLLRGGHGGRGKAVVGQEELEVKGQKLACITVTRTNRRGVVDKRWYCPEIPVGGLVRQERDGEVIKELLDWGLDEAPAGS